MKNILKDVQFNKKDILFLLPVLGITIILVIILCIGIEKCDTYVLSAIAKLHSDILTNILSVITQMSSVWAVVLVLLFLYIIIKDKIISIYLAGAVAIGSILNLIIKYIVRRTRPLDFMIISESGYSFPSAHSELSIILYGFLIYLCCKLIKKKWLKVTLVSFLSVLILTVAFSRLYFGVHYLTDVLAGLTLGYIFIYLYIKICKKYMFKNEGVK